MTSIPTAGVSRPAGRDEAAPAALRAHADATHPVPTPWSTPAPALPRLLPWRPRVAPRKPFDAMTPPERWEHALRVARSHLPAQAQERLRGLLRWETAAAMAAYLGSHAIGLGFVADGLGLGLGLAEGRRLLDRLRPCLARMAGARNLATLEQAGAELARIVAPLLVEGGVAALTAGGTRLARARLPGTPVRKPAAAAPGTLPAPATPAPLAVPAPSRLAVPTAPRLATARASAGGRSALASPPVPRDAAARAALERSVFGGTGAPAPLRQRFGSAAEAWAQRQAAVDGGSVAAQLQALSLRAASPQRAELLRPLVAEQLAGGDDALAAVLRARLRGRDEGALLRLLPLHDGQPSPTQLNELRGALARLIATQAGLPLPARGRLDGLPQGARPGRPPAAQRRWLVNLAASPETRRALAERATQAAAESVTGAARAVAPASTVPARPAGHAAAAPGAVTLDEAAAFVATLRDVRDFDALAATLRGWSRSPGFADQLRSAAGPGLAAVAQALQRAAGQPQPAGRPWQPDDPASVAALARALVQLGSERLARLPAEVLQALNHPVVYRRSLDVYNEGIRRRQAGPLPAPVRPEPEADGLMDAVLSLERALAAQRHGTAARVPPLAESVLGLPPGGAAATAGATAGAASAATPAAIEGAFPGAAGAAASGPARRIATPLLHVHGARIPEQAFEPSPIDTGGRHLFVIPDVHGNEQLLRTLLGTLGRRLQAEALDPSRVMLVQLGDLLNKGADPAGAVRLLDGVARYSVRQDPRGLDGLHPLSRAVLRGLEGLGGLVQLRGNHEELAGYAGHLRADGPLPEYAARTAEMLGKGLPDTVRSYLKRYPEAFAPREREWLAAALRRHPVPDKAGGWTWRDTDAPAVPQGADAPGPAQALEFYAEFRRIWTAGVQASGHRALIDALRPAAEMGNILIAHGGPPASPAAMARLMDHLRRGTPLDDATLHEVLWRRGKSEAELLRKYDALRAGVPDAPTVLIHGHTTGGALGRRASGDAELRSYFLDLGFGLNALPMLYVRPDGQATLFVARRDGRGIVVGAGRPGDLLPGPGNPELPSRIAR